MFAYFYLKDLPYGANVWAPGFSSFWIFLPMVLLLFAVGPCRVSLM
jgi:hypothetical protein